jgi:D-alanyl-D-alanine carboxypeptidase (penicillin-binding protein 5/6)
MAMANDEARAKASQELLNYGFRFYETRRLYEAGKPLAEARVWKGAAEKVSLGIPADLWVTIPRNSLDKISARPEAPRDIEAPIAAGAQLGTLRIMLAGEVLAESPLVPLAPVAEGSLWRQAVDTVLLWFE